MRSCAQIFMPLFKRIARRHGWSTTGLLLALMLLTGCMRQPAVTARGYSVGNQLAPLAQQVFRCSVSGAPRSLDPSLSTDEPSYEVLINLFEGLTTLNARAVVVPGVASSWTVTKNGLRYVFHLRHDARWSNGAPVTAQDFVYAWRRVVDPATAAQYAESLNMIVNAPAIVGGKLPPSALGVHAEGPWTLVVDLREPAPYLLDALTNNYFDPLYPPTIQKWGYAWTTPPHLISDGPFYLANEVINGRLTLLKNPWYWDARAVHLREEVIYPIHNTAAALDRYLAGDIDYAASPTAFPASDLAMLRKDLGAQVVIAPYFGTAYLGMLVHQPPFDNRDLRLALSMAVERHVLDDKLGRGLWIPAYSLMPPLAGYTRQVPAWAHWPRAQRIAEARRLYAAAGYGPGHELRVRLLYPIEGSAERHMMEALSLMWKQNLGADIGLWSEQWKVMLQDIQYKNAKLYWSAWIGNYLDPNTFMRQFQTGYAMNYGDFDNPAYEQPLVQAQHSAAGPTRMALFERAERALGARMPYIPLYFYTADSLVKPWVRGWYPNLMDLHPARYIAILQHTEH